MVRQDSSTNSIASFQDNHMKTHGMKFTPRDEPGCTDANNQNIDVLFRLHEAIKGTRQIRVILYAKGEPFCAPPPADELPVEDILAVEHGVIPLDGADVFQWREMESIGDRVALMRPEDFRRVRISRTSVRRFVSHVSMTRCEKTVP